MTPPQPTLREQAEALRAQGRTYVQIGEALGIDSGQARRLTAPGTRCPNCGGHKTRAGTRCRSCESTEREAAVKDRLADVARRYAAGETAQEIAADLGVSTGAVHCRLTLARKAGLDTGPPRHRGQQADALREALADALDLAERLYGHDEKLTSTEYHARRDRIRAALATPDRERNEQLETGR